MSAASIPWDGAVAVGAVVEGQVHARKEYGVLCDLAAHADVVGLVAPEQVHITATSCSACHTLKAAHRVQCGGLVQVPSVDNVEDVCAYRSQCELASNPLAAA